MTQQAIGQGVGVALVTPMQANGNVDFNAIDRMLKHVSPSQQGLGVDYLVVMGTTAENVTLSADEKAEVLGYILAHKPDGMPVVAGAGGNNTAEVIEVVRDLPISVDAVLSVVPYYNRPTQLGLLQHFSAVANASPRPVILYNVPARTGTNMTAATTLELAEHLNIIGIKEASGNLEQALDISAQMPGHFNLISGDDLLTVPMATFGASGVISVLANCIPHYFSDMCRAAFAGDYHTASAIVRRLGPLNRMMYEEGNPAGVKAALHALGLIDPYTRLPVAQPSAELTDRIARELANLMS